MSKPFLCIFLLFTVLHLSAGQSGQGISHQAVMRDGDGALIANAPVGIRVSILQGGATGDAVYVETHTPVSNAGGLITYVIGQGSVVSGTFSEISWAEGPYYLQTEVDPEGGDNYTIGGVTQFLSVPYSLYSEVSSRTLSPGDGTQQGELLYWDGEGWTALAPGATGEPLVMCDGVPVWGGCYRLHLEASPGAGGIVSGGGFYGKGTQIAVSAEAFEGFTFSGWTGDAQHLDDPASASATVTMPAGNVSLTASFVSDYPMLEGTITDLFDSSPLIDAHIRVYCPDWQTFYGEVYSAADGYYALVLEVPDSLVNLRILIEHADYESHASWLSIDWESPALIYDMALIPLGEDAYVVTGHVFDIFTEEPIAGALVTMEDGDQMRLTLTDSAGHFSLGVYSTGYLFTTIEKEDYVKRHTWATVNESTIVNNFVEINYTIFEEDGIYILYNRTMRSGSGLPGSGFPMQYADTTRHWIAPVGIHIAGDNSLVGGQDIELQVSNLLYNANNFLPYFAPNYALPENIFYHEEFGYQLQDNEMAAYFTNNIPGLGAVFRIYEGPRYKNCIAMFKPAVGSGVIYGPEHPAFHQELGSCFGAVLEPPELDGFPTVFTGGSQETNYTIHDLQMSTLYNDRSKIHYRNMTFAQSDSNGWDWEARPDIVEQWYNEDILGKGLYEETFEQIIFDYDGSVKEKNVWTRNEIPYKVMENYPMLFTEEEVEQRKQQEKREK